MIRKLSLIAILGLLSLFIVQDTLALTPDELRQSISAKTKELETVTNQIKETQNQLGQLENQKKTLGSDIKGLDYSISQLNLSIRSSEINIEKLKLELELLNDKRQDTETSIDVQREAIAKLLREIQQKDKESLADVLLRNNSLADSVFEIQSLHDLQGNLSVNVGELTKLHEDLSKNIEDAAKTKVNLEVENNNFKNRKVIVNDQKQEKNSLLISTKNKESAYQKQLTDLELKQEAIGKEIGDLETNLRAAFDPSVLPSKRTGVLAYPLANPLFTQQYGATSFAKRAYKTGFHNGLDFQAPIGTPIFASDDGTVAAVGDNGKIQYGKYILLKHGNNLATLYAHLSKQVVGNGSYVKRGELVGYSGKTGYSTGPHLHLSVYWAPSVILKSFPGAGLVPVGVTINPMDYL